MDKNQAEFTNQTWLTENQTGLILTQGTPQALLSLAVAVLLSSRPDRIITNKKKTF